MKITNTTWKDMWDVMPDKLTKPSEKLFNKLPENIKEGLTVGVETAWDHYLATGKLQEALAMGAADGIRTATAQSGEFTKAAGNIVSGMLEGKSWRKGLGEEMSLSLNKKGNYLNTQLEKLNFNAELEAEYGQASYDIFKQDQKDYQAQADKAQEMYKWSQTQSGKRYGSMGAAHYKKQMEDAQKLADQAGKDARNEHLKSSAKHAAYAGAGSALTAGVDTFARTGSFKEAGKAAGMAGLQTATSAGVTMALSTTPLAPIAPLLGSVAGSLVGGLFGGRGKQPLRGAGARAKVAGSLAGALRMARKPGGEQLYHMFKRGSSGSKTMSKFIDNAMQNSQGQLDEGLKGELVSNIGSVISRTTGTQFSTNEVLSLLAALKGTGMQDHEQKAMLTNFERRIEGAGARGAIVNRPTVALIGEAGPEAITPLDQTRGNAPLPGGGDLVEEIRQMNSLLKQVVTSPPPINLDGQRVSKVLNSVNSDDIRTGVSTVNSRI